MYVRDFSCIGEAVDSLLNQYNRMKEISLKEVQISSLQILKKVHDFCSINGINYSLAYGTLLGAIRHKGFIPWDDDIDIMMPRPDYERFCSSFRMEGVSLHCHQNDPDCYLLYARVCDDLFTVSSKNSWRRGGGHTGLWIDIFPIDAVEDDPDEYKRRFKKSEFYYYKLFKYRAYLNGLSKENSFKLNCLALLLEIWPFSYIMKRRVYQFVDKAVKFHSEIPFNKTRSCSQIALPNNGSIHPVMSSAFKSYLLMPFEDAEFYCIADYDKLLKNWYGDYMQLPPESERVPAHSSWQSFYWK